MEEVDDLYALYNLANDPNESRNLATVNPDKLRTMMQGMARELGSRDTVYPVRDETTLKPMIPEGKNP